MAISDMCAAYKFSPRLLVKIYYIISVQIVTNSSNEFANVSNCYHVTK